MQLIIKRSKADSFIKAMSVLEIKFKDYVDGELSDVVKITISNGKPELKFAKSVPEMVRIACYMVFVETLL